MSATCSCGKPVTQSVAVDVRARCALLKDMCDDCTEKFEAAEKAKHLDWAGKTLDGLIKELNGRLTQEGLVDEYFGRCTYPRNHKIWTTKTEDLRFRWIVCFAVTGTSEGHYIHIDLYLDGYGEDGGAPNFHVALGKTFQGFDHAWKIAKRCAELLGA